MNSESEQGIGGVQIKPSARKSIHSHCSKCKSGTHRAMGRYGLHARSSRPLTIQDQGIDEVDNVLSKLQRPVSPVQVRKNNNILHRRRSFENDYNEFDYDDDCLLSKSCPETFSNYSDEQYESANTTSLDKDLQNISPQETSSESTLDDSTNSLQNSTLLSQVGNQKNVKDKSDNMQFILKILLVFLVVFVALIFNMLSNTSDTRDSTYDKISFYNDVKVLGEKYKVKGDSILQVGTGVVTIFENQDTGSFIFAYNSKISQFNPVNFNSFVEGMTATASKYLRNNTKAEEHVMIDTTDLNVQTEKEFMNKYKDDVAKTGVMLVKDVDDIPSHIAMAFHYYCDEYSPLVRKSAIFFTLNLAKCKNGSDPQSTHKYIEKCLANRWNTIGEDKIRPLLTRVVNVVVDVTNI